MQTIGRHVIAELDGCDSKILSDPTQVRTHLLEAARRAGATILAHEIFDFQNGGVSGFVLLAESHVSIHTWPEHGYAAIDIYTCGDYTMPEKGCVYLADALGASRVKTSSLTRGLPVRGGSHEHFLSAGGPARAVKPGSTIPYSQSA